MIIFVKCLPRLISISTIFKDKISLRNCRKIILVYMTYMKYVKKFLNQEGLQIEIGVIFSIPKNLQTINLEISTRALHIIVKALIYIQISRKLLFHKIREAKTMELLIQTISREIEDLMRVIQICIQDHPHTKIDLAILIIPNTNTLRTKERYSKTLININSLTPHKQVILVLQQVNIQIIRITHNILTPKISNTNLKIDLLPIQLLHKITLTSLLTIPKTIKPIIILKNKLLLIPFLSLINNLIIHRTLKIILKTTPKNGFIQASLSNFSMKTDTI